jgi:sirohydrochlorin cobaltochelatase
MERTLSTPMRQMRDASIAKPAILVVSFGTSHSDTREATIGAIERAIQEAFPDRQVRRAFTSRIVLGVLRRRDGLEIDDVRQAMDHLVSDGVQDLIVQPTHVMNGFEFDRMIEAIAPYKEAFAALKVGAPLLSSAEDYKQLVDEISSELPQTQAGEAIALMGHGGSHFAGSAYAALDYAFKDMGHANVFVGAVEGYPDLETIVRHVTDFGATRVLLLPLMIVAGDHAKNDMAGDGEGSWKAAFEGAGCEVACVLRGLGEYRGVREHFVRHVRAAIEGTARG